MHGMLIGSIIKPLENLLTMALHGAHSYTRFCFTGMPNVGKSTLFNALVGDATAMAANFPFCTIEPNVGIVNVPDSRLERLGEIHKSEKVVYASMEVCMPGM